jgi:type IV secretory pathway TraG/TraD family ATPase VirD4
MKLLKHPLMLGFGFVLGYVVYSQFPGFVARLAFGGPTFLGWVFLYAVVCSDRSAIKAEVLRFGPLSWQESDLAHILILGQTRRGKTSSGLSQIINQISAVFPNWGGLVLGVKNTEHEFYRAHFKDTAREDQLVVLQVRGNDHSESWNPPARINLTGDRRIPHAGYAKMLVDAAKSLSGEGGNPFWADTAQQLFTLGFELLDKLGCPYTIPELYRALTDTSRLQTLLKELREDYEGDLQAERIHNELDSQLISSDAKDQLEGTRGTLKQYLGFFMQPDIYRVFCSESPTCSIAEMDYGKIFCTSIPQHFPTERRYIHTFLKQLAYYHGMMRFDKEAERQGHIAGSNQLFFVFDEAQDVITASETGMSDHTVLDRIGGAKVHVIFSMQSAASPESKIRREATRNLINHFSTRLYFQLGDEEEAIAAAKFVGQTKKRRVRKSYNLVGTGGLPIIGPSGKSVDFGESYEVPPVAFLRLDQHQAVVLHPTKRWHVMDVPALDPKGNRESWWKPAGAGRIRRLIRDSYR